MLRNYDEYALRNKAYFVKDIVVEKKLGSKIRVWDCLDECLLEERGWPPFSGWRCELR